MTMITIKVAFKRDDEDYWTLLEKDIGGAADIDRLADEAAEAVRHSGELIKKKLK